MHCHGNTTRPSLIKFEPAAPLPSPFLPGNWCGQCNEIPQTCLQIIKVNFIHEDVTTAACLWTGCGSLSECFSFPCPSGVPEKPEIDGLPKPAVEGDQVTLTCVTYGSKPAADIRWFRNEKEIKGRILTKAGVLMALGWRMNLNNTFLKVAHRSEDH